MAIRQTPHYRCHFVHPKVAPVNGTSRIPALPVDRWLAVLDSRRTLQAEHSTELDVEVIFLRIAHHADKLIFDELCQGYVARDLPAPRIHRVLRAILALPLTEHVFKVQN